MENRGIKILKDGPYLVSGDIELNEKIMIKEGPKREYKKGQNLAQAKTYALCRCGHSKNPPFCDGTHAKLNFSSTETASDAPYESRAKELKGPTIDLYDDGRCAFARFCHQEHGDVWDLTVNSDDPTMRKEAIAASVKCPTGRLVHHDKLAPNGAIEPDLKPAISVLQDPDRGVSGPLFVQGGIPLNGSDGKYYGQQNRYALCRCGESRNKPFCDATHVNAAYVDGLDEIGKSK